MISTSPQAAAMCSGLKPSGFTFSANFGINFRSSGTKSKMAGQTSDVQRRVTGSFESHLLEDEPIAADQVILAVRYCPFELLLATFAPFDRT
ncbi:hypothetical protein NL676_009415 [Syzygium grande]|nr:hypothetical protein NL676_009415 [Syzygium grande]